ncbi:hypothetical protein [Ferruginibacter sp.]
MSNFITYCINGDALMSEIDDYIAQWHDNAIETELHDFLGMSKKEYALFVEDENYLGLIITAHRDNIDIKLIIRNEMAMVARSDNPAKSRRLQEWLESEGIWE